MAETAIRRSLSRRSPIFVTGASRSGTTLLARILGNNRAVLTLNEMHFFGDLVSATDLDENIGEGRLRRAAAMLMARQHRDFWVDRPTTEELDIADDIINNLQAIDRTIANVYASVMDHLCEAECKERYCEQTPRYIFYAREILEAFPDARIVHMVRDPRALLASQKNRWRLRRLGGRNVPRLETLRLWVNYHPSTMTRLWKAATDSALSLAGDRRFKIIRFEDLVADPQSVIRDLCEFLELEYQGEMLDVPQWGSSNFAADQSNRGISVAMLDKWKEILSEDEIAYSEMCTRSHMERFAYAVSGNGRISVFGRLKLAVRYPLHLLGAAAINPRRIAIQLAAILNRKAGPGRA